MYWDINKSLSYNALFNFIVGNRGAGKTYGSKKWENFKQGTKYIGKLTPKTVQGGIILIPIEFSMNGKKVLTMKKEK